LIGTNLGDRWFFLFGFEKNERDNIDDRELGALRRLASVLLNLGANELMDQLAVFGRHFDGGECVVVLENGGRMAGADIKVATSLSVCSFGRWAAGRTRCLGGHLRMAAVSDPRSSNWGLSMNAYTHHREGAGRNFVAIVLGPVNTNGLSE
jgi:hypothetical protein